MDELQTLEEMGIDPEKNVVQLKRTGFIELQPTDIPSSRFTLIGERFFVVNHFGPIDVYNFNGQKDSLVYFRQGQIRNIATDESYLYLHLTGDFDLDPNDLLFVRDRNPEGQTDFGAELVAEPFGKIGRAKENGIEARVVSINSDDIPSRSVIFLPDILAAKNTRIVIPKGLNFGCGLYSQGSFATVNYSAFHTEDHHSLHLRNGRILETLDGIPKPDNGLVSKLIFTKDANSPFGFDVDIPYYNLKLHEHDAATEGYSIQKLPMTFGANHPKKNVLGILEQGNKLYVLHDPESYKNNDGVIQVTTPAYLERYDVSLKQIK